MSPPRSRNDTATKAAIVFKKMILDSNHAAFSTQSVSSSYIPKMDKIFYALIEKVSNISSTLRTRSSNVGK